MDRPEEILHDEPLEVTRMECDFISTRLAGRVFYRADETGRYWVRPIGAYACEFLRQLFETSRRPSAKIQGL